MAATFFNSGDRQVPGLYPENMGREGFFINLQAIASYFLGTRAVGAASRSALFGVLTVRTIYLLVSALLTVRIALFASFFVATSYWHLMLSRMGTRAITAPFFLTLALYLLLSVSSACAGASLSWSG